MCVCVCVCVMLVRFLCAEHRHCHVYEVYDHPDLCVQLCRKCVLSAALGSLNSVTERLEDEHWLQAGHIS